MMKKRLTLLCVLLIASIACLTWGSVAYAENAASDVGKSSREGQSRSEVAEDADENLGAAAELAKDIDAHRVPRLDDVPYINQSEDDTTAPDLHIDESVRYTYDAQFSDRNGRWDFNDGTYTSAEKNSLAVDTSVPFRYGTFSCNILADASSDNGLVFCFSGDGAWESGNRYYFYFIDKNGGVYLGKADNGSWTQINRVVVSPSYSEVHELKVILLGYRVLCYFDGELLFSYKDINILSGSGYGIRAGGAGVVVSDVNVTNDYVYGEDD